MAAVARQDRLAGSDWYGALPESRKEVYRAAQRRYWRKNRDRLVLRHLGIAGDRSARLYRELWLKQGGLCAICDSPPTHNGNRQLDKSNLHARLLVDHCHLTNRIRGLLCDRCNKAIGMLEDDPNILRTAAAYLEKEN